MVGESLKHLIHEWKWEVIFLCIFVQLSIINAHSPPGHGTSGDVIPTFILDNGHTTLLWNYMDGAYPFAIRDSLYNSRLS